MSRPLTSQQQAVYDLIRDRIVSRGYGPTVREIGEHMHIKSPNGVMCHLRALERKGMIVRSANKSRAIELTESLASVVGRNFPDARLTVAGEISGGWCSYRNSHPESLSLAEWSGNGHSGWRVVDHALRDFHICAGDVLVVRHSAQSTTAALVVVRISTGDTCLCQQELDNDGRLQRRRLGPSSAKFAAEAGEISGELLGVVVGVIRQFPARTQPVTPAE